MPQIESTILESWPALKEDLNSLLSDTDAWIISELKKAYETREWGKVLNIIDIMGLIHNMSHSH
ncbi:hypothetical protein ACFLT8_00780 [Chloroflexota bacterium]